ncbi:hypothetical protein [Deinococcus sp. YIM 77859]|uniref:hypothetical protein n=1 Tax=Deinococcus sp. YIM 77859 TaxID=1540221 RepID=UPI0005511DA9|nr:hypothetical protein [Deinococcus sp. YIM 77859]
MPVLSRVALLLGVVILLVAAFLLAKNVIDINQLHAVANANRSRDFPSPVNQVLLMTGLALLGGFFTGLGLGLPRRSRAAA